VSACADRLFGKRGPNPLKFGTAKTTPVAGSSLRRSLLAKVHVAKKELNLADDDYRAILLDVAGVSSAANCSPKQLADVIERFKARGWKEAKPVGKRAGPKPADHPGAGKARAMWISLHHLGAIPDPSEAALEGFARKQLKCERMQWADQAQMYKLIEALKARAERAGWDQSLVGIAPDSSVRVLKLRLIEALFAKLVAAELAPADWLAERAAFEFGGIEIRAVMLATASELDQVAQVFGDTLRENSR